MILRTGMQDTGLSVYRRYFFLTINGGRSLLMRGASAVYSLLQTVSAEKVKPLRLCRWRTVL